MIDCEFDNGRKAKLRHAVVDCILVKKNIILLVKRAKNMAIEPGKWTLPGGYMDRDETLVEAARRELLEESGWQAKELTLLRVNDNPNRPGENNQNVNFIFYGDSDKKVGDSDYEIEEIKWFDLDKVPPAAQIAFDHAENIELYKKWLKEKFTLPKFG